MPASTGADTTKAGPRKGARPVWGKSLCYMNGGGGTRTPKGLRPPHFEGPALLHELPASATRCPSLLDSSPPAPDRRRGGASPFQWELVDTAADTAFLGEVA